MISILSQLNPVHILLTYLFKIYLVLLYHLCLFYSGLPTKILYTFLISPMHVTFTTHLILLDLITVIMLGELYKL